MTKGRKLAPVKASDTSVRADRREKFAKFEEQNNVLDALPDKAPSGLGTEGAKVWRKVVKELKKVGIVKDIDRYNLIMFCQFWETYLQAQQEVIDNGATVMRESGPAKNPAYNVMNDSASKLITLSNQLGLTFTSRAQMLWALSDNDKNKKTTANAFARWGGVRS